MTPAFSVSAGYSLLTRLSSRHACPVVLPLSEEMKRWQGPAKGVFETDRLLQRYLYQNLGLSRLPVVIDNIAQYHRSTYVQNI
jgi:hypothetical protein